MAASVTGRSHTGQAIPVGTPVARAFDLCSVAAAPELRPLKRHATFAAQHQNRLPGRGRCTDLPTSATLAIVSSSVGIRHADGGAVGRSLAGAATLHCTVSPWGCLP